MAGGWALGQSCSPCAPPPARPRPCAERVTAASAAWATKGTAARAQVSKQLVGEGRCAVPLLSPDPNHLPCPQWRTCVRTGVEVAASMPTAAR